MFTVKGYFNTGFDIINIPDSPALLRSSAGGTIEYPALDILNKRFLSSVKIKINPAMSDSQLDGLDYIELKEEGQTGDGVFYYVSSYRLTSKDVAVLNLVQDSILTAGGINVVKTVYAKRAHIAKSQDLFGAYDADDELLMPKEPLLLVHSGSRSEFKDDSGTNVGYNDGKSGMFFQFMNAGQWGSGEGQQTVVVSTVGLARTDSPDSYLTYSGGVNTFGTWGITDYSEQATGHDTRWPKIPNARGITIELPQIYRNVATLVPYSDSQYLIDRKIPYAGIEYNILGSQVYSYYSSIEALDVLRSVGMENSIIACYRLRRGEGQLYNNDAPGNLPNRLKGQTYIYSTNGWTSGGAWSGEGSGASGRVQAYSEAYDYDYLGDQIKNMRVLYGQFRKYILASPATGSALEAKPEELTGRMFTADYSTVGNTGRNGAPYICCFTDPRPTGRPYFNFLKFGQLLKKYADNNASVVNLAEGAIAGGQWPEVPIVFTGMSGEWSAKVGYNLDASYRDYLASPEKTYRDMVQGATMEQLNAYNDASAGANMISSTLQGGISGAAVGGAYGAAGGAVMGAVTSATGSIIQAATADAAYNQRLENATLDIMRGYSSGQALVDAANSGNTAANRMLERQYARSYERAKFDLSTSYSVPRAKFMSTDSLRDLTNNGAFYARYTPTKNDLIRMDNILNAFGYKVDQLMSNPAGNRTKFCYIEGTVEKFNQFNCPGKKEIMLDINSQLANGVRVWHVNPKNKDIYDPG